MQVTLINIKNIIFEMFFVIINILKYCGLDLDIF